MLPTKIDQAKPGPLLEIDRKTDLLDTQTYIQHVKDFCVVSVCRVHTNVSNKRKKGLNDR